jgi:hypothetical protein
MSANVARKSPVSISGKVIRSSGARVGRRIATGSPTGTSPRSRVLCRQCDRGRIVQGWRQRFFAGDGRPLPVRHLSCTPSHTSARATTWMRSLIHFLTISGAQDHRSELFVGSWQVQMGTPSCSRSIISIRVCRCIRPTQPIPLSRSGLSRSCWRRSINDCNAPSSAPRSRTPRTGSRSAS